MTILVEGVDAGGCHHRTLLQLERIVAMGTNHATSAVTITVVYSLFPSLSLSFSLMDLSVVMVSKCIDALLAPFWTRPAQRLHTILTDAIVHTLLYYWCTVYKSMRWKLLRNQLQVIAQTVDLRCIISLNVCYCLKLRSTM